MIQVTHQDKPQLLVRDTARGLELLDIMTCQTLILPGDSHLPQPITQRPQPQPVPGFLSFSSRPRDFLSSLRKCRTLLLTLSSKTKKTSEPSLFGPVDVTAPAKTRTKKQTKIERDMAALALKFGLSLTKKD